MERSDKEAPRVYRMAGEIEPIQGTVPRCQGRRSRRRAPTSAKHGAMLGPAMAGRPHEHSATDTGRSDRELLHV